MNVNVILDLGLGANILELFYRTNIPLFKYGEIDFLKKNFSSVIDLPQYFIAAAIASIFFSGPIPLLVFVGLPVTFKAIDLVTKQGTILNKMVRAGSHLMRLTSKVIIITASFHSIFAISLLSSAGIWPLTRTFILLYSFLKDATITSLYGMSSENNFENAFVWLS